MCRDGEADLSRTERNISQRRLANSRSLERCIRQYLVGLVLVIAVGSWPRRSWQTLDRSRPVAASCSPVRRPVPSRPFSLPLDRLFDGRLGQPRPGSSVCLPGRTSAELRLIRLWPAGSNQSTCWWPRWPVPLWQALQRRGRSASAPVVSATSSHSVSNRYRGR